MPITYDIRRDLRFQQGKSEGIIIGANKKSTALTKNLLQRTDYSIEQIADLVGVPIEFVLKIKKNL